MGTPATQQAPLKEKPVIGYPSMGRYHQTQMPPGYPVPMHTVASTSSIRAQANYPIYATNPHSNSYNAYYYQDPYLPMIPEPQKTTSFGRVMLVFAITIVAIMCTMSLVMWFLFGTYIPGFQIKSLNLSNFTATDTSFTGKWEANVTVSNLNEGLELEFSKATCSVFYREAIMGISLMQPFELKKRQAVDLDVRVPAAQTTGGAGDLQGLILPSLVHDQRNGIVVFSLRLAFHVNFVSSGVVYKQEVVRVYCENLKVKISGSGEGTLAQDFGSECLLRIDSE
ncbi:hydroxyproline-rich glycoprotein [Dorcoceras hygrometricum]|uniref:Hydroxyproline-rich glycoprotein n=1 Tax=Dorcoceras hygrometricum TaxID=472368 RepID=A0A2Z7B3R8_9LAMI|nr:hydroxyproline-rich glycoprotein [Dorcoceras hygrometricum]